MILQEKTREELGIDINTLKKGSAKRVFFQCDSCRAEYLKPYRDCINGSGICSKCSRIKRGKILGNTFGKNQEVRGSCRGCKSPIRTSLKWCSDCSDLKNNHLSKNMSGANNPAWTGKHICKCGNKKSFGAKQCRNCSFQQGKRSGLNNGRYIKKNREYWKECKKSKSSLSGLMSNVCKNLGIQKNNQKTVDMLGYSWKEFKEHIEKQFKPGMTWKNHGKWHIDHITPVEAFISNNIYDVRLVNALNNLQPLWATDNLKKGTNRNKTKLILLAGPSGSGKTTLINELNSDAAIDGDDVDPTELLYLTLNKKVVVYAITFGITTFIKQYGEFYDIILYTIDVSEDVLKKNLMARGSQITESIINRNRRIKSLSNRSNLHADVTIIKRHILKMIGDKE